MVLTPEWHLYPCRSFFSLPKGMKPPEPQQTRLVYSETKGVEQPSSSGEEDAEGEGSTSALASAPAAAVKPKGKKEGENTGARALSFLPFAPVAVD